MRVVPTVSARIDSGPAAGLVGASLVVEPRAGVRPLTRAINRANDRVFVEAYILTDTPVVHALERAATQGVDVYVLLEHHPLGMGTQPERMAQMLRAAGVEVRWAAPYVQLTHTKLVVLDDRLAVVSTANFSRSAFHSNREVLVFLRQRSVVRTLSNLFRADWDRLPLALDNPNVLVAPYTARSGLDRLLRSARRSIRLYAEEVADLALQRFLTDRARHGVRVRVILPWGATPSGAMALARGGVQVGEMRSPYVHAKVITVDGREGFVGSENISTASLDRNREVGVLLRGAAVTQLDRLFDGDWSRSTALLPSRGARG